MVKVFRVPKLGLTMDQVTVNGWLKEPGDLVQAGDPFVTVETDKAALDVEATEDGYLRQRAAAVGESVPVGAPLAVFSTTRDEALGQAPADGDIGAPPPARAEATPVARTTDVPTGPRHRASPAVRRRARELGIDLVTLGGSGPSGRIRMRDLDNFRPAPAAPVATSGAERRVLSRVRRVSAERMVESARSIPQYSLRRYVDVTTLTGMLTTLRANFGKGLSITDFILQATAQAIMAHPLLRSEMTEPLSEGVYLVHPHADVGLAVDTPEGILVPVIPAAEELSLAQFAAARHEAVAAAMEGRILSRFAGRATFTISNLGPFGVDEFHALVTPGETGVLAVGAVRRVPHMDFGTLCEKDVIALTWTFDHRLVDGVQGARFSETLTTAIGKGSWRLV